MCIATLSDDSDMLSMFVFSLVRNQRAELDGSGWAVRTQRQRVWHHWGIPKLAREAAL